MLLVSFNAKQEQHIGVLVDEEIVVLSLLGSPFHSMQSLIEAGAKTPLISIEEQLNQIIART